MSAQPIWTRAWRYKAKKKGRVHIEVRDPDQTFGFVRSYRGKDHTYHVILEEGYKKPRKAAHSRKVKPKVKTITVHDPDATRAALYKVREGLTRGMQKMDTDGSWVSLTYILDLLDSAEPKTEVQP